MAEGARRVLAVLWGSDAADLVACCRLLLLSGERVGFARSGVVLEREWWDHAYVRDE
jgi:hypothetical protein